MEIYFACFLGVIVMICAVLDFLFWEPGKDTPRDETPPYWVMDDRD